MQAPVSCHVLSTEALGDDFNGSLHDGGNACRCCSRVRAGCGVRPHSRGVGNGIGSDTILLGTANVNRLACDQFNDQRAPNLSECSTCNISD
jgi:hypothetical protein